MVSINMHWNQLLWNCYHHGRKAKKDDSEIIELMGNYVFLERPQDITETFFIKEIDTCYQFLEGIKQGLYDLPGYPIKGEALYQYVNSWEDLNQIFIHPDQRAKHNLEGKGFVYTYPERLLNILNVLNMETDNAKIGFVDQFNTIYNRLRENQGSNRAVATLYHPGIDKSREDIPCLNWLQATVRDSKLELHCMFRSNDLYGAWPSNMYFLTELGLWLSEQFIDENIMFNGIHYHSSSLHIYKTDMPAVEQILGENK